MLNRFEIWTKIQNENITTKDAIRIYYQLYFEMPQATTKFTMVNADATTKEYSEQSDRMRHLVVKSV